MKIYEIRFCKKNDLPILKDFIKNHWQSDHIFVKSQSILDFQHYDKNLDIYNFVIGLNTISKEIDGIIGIIPLSHYDKKLDKYSVTWGGIWKVRSDVNNLEITNLGSALFSFFESYDSHCSIGMSDIATFLHKIRKYKVGYLNQYYILNKRISNFNIAEINDSSIDKLQNQNSSNAKLIEVANPLDLNHKNYNNLYYPYKSITYLYNRFYLHPIYKYNFFEIQYKNNFTTIVTRKINILGSSIIRIVDVFGKLENFDCLYDQFSELLMNENAEYIDILNYGINNSTFNKIGFNQLKSNDINIIPNYFEPFVKKNIKINFAFKSNSDFTIFKADADQDRPSKI